MIRSADELLGVIVEHVSDTSEGAGTRSPKLATVDSTYVGSNGLPKVKFDGDTTLSPNGFSVIRGYRPQANDRVLMVPAGNSYVIVGPLTVNTNTLFQPSANLTVTTSITTQPFTLGTIIIDDPGVPYNVELFAGADVATSGTWKLEIRDGSTSGTKIGGTQSDEHMVAQGISPTVVTGAKTYYAMLVTADSPVQTLTILNNLQFYAKIYP
jgi:hypothetical protein